MLPSFHVQKNSGDTTPFNSTCSLEEKVPAMVWLLTVGTVSLTTPFGNLLLAIHELVAHNVQDCQYTPLAVHLAHWQFLLYGQGQTLSVATYYQKFNNVADMLYYCWATTDKMNVLFIRCYRLVESNPTHPPKKKRWMPMLKYRSHIWE